MSLRADHMPTGDPCECGLPFEWHRVDHKFVALVEDERRCNECKHCGLSERQHRGRTTYRAPALIKPPKPPKLRAPRSPRVLRQPRVPRPPKDPVKEFIRRKIWRDEPKGEKIFVGIDGEGCGRAPHRYVMLCLRDELDHRSDHVERESGLTTEDCFDLMLRQSKKCSFFSFAFTYDLTKILTDLPPPKLWVLNHPETRMSRGQFSKPMPVVWRGPSGATYRINLLASKFTLERGKPGTKNPDRVVIWDVFRFFGTSFVRALTDWDVGTPEVREQIQKMKDQRGSDDWMNDSKARDAARTYCFDECLLLSRLVRKLVRACESAGLELKQFYGAGSLADAMMKTISIKEKIVKEPREMRWPVMSAFFGGRFENSVVGEVPGPLYNADIASAYPYQTTFLPCLRHSKWTRTRTRERIGDAQAALVRYRLGKAPKDASWGPLPFRQRDGTIVYPSESGGGWVWRNEYEVAEKHFPNVQFMEAYLLRSECTCRPFAMVPRWYRERLQIGKEGKGLIFKLGPNSIYGKLAQSIGATPPYQCWTWAGLITSGCRAQLLELMAQHEDLNDVLAVATDGVISRQRVELPLPRDTGTFDCVKSDKEIHKSAGKLCASCGVVNCSLAHKALGSWERKVTEAGVFFARPGIYFDLEMASTVERFQLEMEACQSAERKEALSEEIRKLDASIRARGLGRRTLLEYVAQLRQAWREGKDGLLVSGELHARFQGMRSCIRRRLNGSFVRSSEYGEWRPMPVDMSFEPMPKRFGMERRGSFATMRVRAISRNLVSSPYEGKISPERAMFAEAARIASEQPDGDDFEGQVE